MSGREKALSVARDYLSHHIQSEMIDVHYFDNDLTIGWAEAEEKYYMRIGELSTHWGTAKDMRKWLDTIEDQRIISMFCYLFKDWDLNTFEIIQEIYEMYSDPNREENDGNK